jgi:hypothetical protein
LEVNSLGDVESRDRYRAALREYLSSQRAFLSPESLLRYALTHPQRGHRFLTSLAWRVRGSG